MLWIRRQVNAAVCEDMCSICSCQVFCVCTVGTSCTSACCMNTCEARRSSFAFRQSGEARRNQTLYGLSSALSTIDGFRTAGATQVAGSMVLYWTEDPEYTMHVQYHLLGITQCGPSPSNART